MASPGQASPGQPMMQQFGLIAISNKQVKTCFGKSDAITMPDLSLNMFETSE
jgi:hypothetical protein